MKKIDSIKNNIIPIEKVAEILGVSIKDIENEIDYGKLNARVISPRGKEKHYIISCKNFEDYLNNPKEKKSNTF
jgi:hypothetical protein